MKIDKIELKERTFTPYKISITVENEVEHKDLLKAFSEILNSRTLFNVFDYWPRNGGTKTLRDFFRQIYDEIVNHPK